MGFSRVDVEKVRANATNDCSGFAVEFLQVSLLQRVRLGVRKKKVGLLDELRIAQLERDGGSSS